MEQTKSQPQIVLGLANNNNNNNIVSSPHMFDETGMHSTYRQHIRRIDMYAWLYEA